MAGKREEHSLPIGLLRPYPEEDMKSSRVSDKVGNAKNNWAELIEPTSASEPRTKKPVKGAKTKKEPPT